MFEVPKEIRNQIDYTIKSKKMASFIPYFSGFSTPNKGTNYDTPLENLWFKNFLRKRVLEREIEVLERSINLFTDEGFKYDKYIVLELRGFKYGQSFAFHWNQGLNPDYYLSSSRYLELRKLELKNLTLSSRRFLMELDCEIAMAYNKRKSEGKSFYLNKILTNPLNHYSARTDSEGYIAPIFGDLTVVKNCIGAKAVFSGIKKDEKDYQYTMQNLHVYDWFVNYFLNGNREVNGDKDWYKQDGIILRVAYIAASQAKYKLESSFQKMVKERAVAMDKGLIPIPRA